MIADLVSGYVEHNYANGISLRDVAAAFGYSASQKLLDDGNVSVSAACEAVGFSDLRYFTRQFVRYSGVTPGRFRNWSGSAWWLAGVCRVEPLPQRRSARPRRCR
jgi:AraC-like DNA-binding protein